MENLEDKNYSYDADAEISESTEGSQTDEGLEIFEEAMERFHYAKDIFAETFKNYEDDINFSLLGNQWEASILNARQNEKRTTGVFNKLAPLIRNIVNTSLKNCPAIKVQPRSNKDKQIQKIMDGLVKFIQNESNAESIYNETLKSAVAGGIGVFEIVVEDNYGSEKCLKIKRIVDPTSVYPDPEAIQPDMSDAKWLFHLKTISKKEFEKLYPGKESSELEERNKDWFPDGSVTIAEYWIKKDDGKVCWYILNGNEIIDSSDWATDDMGNPTPYPGTIIPYCFVIGEEIWIDGQRKIKSVVSDVKDYQRVYNYMQSEAIDYVSKTAKAPYIAADDAIAPYKQLWDNVNTANTPYLPYVGGKSVPQRTDPPAPPVGYIDSMTRIDGDIRSAVGVRDPLQDIPASNSGKAIQLQLAQSNVNTYVWTDHLNRAIKHAGRILVDLIPHYYNYPHVQEILGIDGQMTNAQIMTPYLENGEYKMINLMSDEYSVSISTGASYQDQRKETFDSLIELAKINPQIIQVAGDVILRQMDFAESNEIADRLAAVLPAPIQAIAGQGNSEYAAKQQAAILNQKLQQAMQTIDQLTKTLNAKTQETQMLNVQLQDKSEAANIKAQADLQKQAMNNANDKELKMMEAHADVTKTQIEAETDLKLKELEMMIESLKAQSNKTIVGIQLQ